MSMFCVRLMYTLKLIVGVRYQCASCPSAPTAYNLVGSVRSPTVRRSCVTQCASCEPRSYIVHNPMHIFFKLPRPVHRALQSAMPFLPPLYRKPAGPAFGNADPANPAHYLRSLLHLGVACDTCIERIRGLWYWCVYCAKDLDEAHEALDTHDPTHVFVVFKSEVDMTAFRSVPPPWERCRMQTDGSGTDDSHRQSRARANRRWCRILFISYRRRARCFIFAVICFLVSYVCTTSNCCNLNESVCGVDASAYRRPELMV
jgi:hypothetical protein